MANVAVRHQEIVRADDGVLGELGRAMNGDVFAENIMVSDSEASGLTVVLQILRGIAHDAAGMKLIVSANGRETRQMHMGPDAAMRAHGDIFFDDRIRSDDDAGVELR